MTSEKKGTKAKHERNQAIESYCPELPDVDYGSSLYCFGSLDKEHRVDDGAQPAHDLEHVETKAECFDSVARVLCSAKGVRVPFSRLDETGSPSARI